VRRAAWLALLPVLACAPLARSTDRGLVGGPPAVIGMATGAAVNTGLLVLKRPWYERLGASAVVGLVPRFALRTKPEGWHLEVWVGAAVSEWASWLVCRGPCHRRHP
jgi:hypothetical protein